MPDDDEGATVEVSGKVAAKLDDNRVRGRPHRAHGDAKVLGRAQAVVAPRLTARAHGATDVPLTRS